MRSDLWCSIFFSHSIQKFGLGFVNQRTVDRWVEFVTNSEFSNFRFLTFVSILLVYQPSKTFMFLIFVKLYTGCSAFEFTSKKTTKHMNVARGALSGGWTRGKLISQENEFGKLCRNPTRLPLQINKKLFKKCSSQLKTLYVYGCVWVVCRFS